MIGKIQLAEFGAAGNSQGMNDETDSVTRTQWAEDRTILATERMFASWMGTGLGAIGVSIGLKAVFGATEPTWVAKGVASLFLLVAIVIFLDGTAAGRKNADQTQQE